MRREMTLLTIGFFGLLADLFCFQATLQNRPVFVGRRPSAFFILEIFAGVFCVFLIYFFAKKILTKRSRFVKNLPPSDRQFLPVWFGRSDRSGF